MICRNLGHAAVRVSFLFLAFFIAQSCVLAGPALEIESAIGCLMSLDWVRKDLKELGLKPGDKATVRFTTDPIPGTSPSDAGTLKIFVYDRRQAHGWLLFARKSADGYTVLRNGYRLQVVDRQWAASEGNGGVATYNAVSSFATKIASQTPTVERLIAASAPCPVEQ